jgi:hypothetical protein
MEVPLEMQLSLHSVHVRLSVMTLNSKENSTSRMSHEGSLINVMMLGVLMVIVLHSSETEDSISLVRCIMLFREESSDSPLPCLPAPVPPVGGAGNHLGRREGGELYLNLIPSCGESLFIQFMDFCWKMFEDGL